MLNRWLPTPFCTSCYLLKWFRLKIFGAKVTVLADSLTPAVVCLATYMWDMWTQEWWFGKDAVWIWNWIRKTASCLSFPILYIDQLLILKTDGVPACDGLCTLVPVQTSDHGLNLQTLWHMIDSNGPKKNAEDANQMCLTFYTAGNDTVPLSKIRPSENSTNGWVSHPKLGQLPWSHTKKKPLDIRHTHTVDGWNPAPGMDELMNPLEKNGKN